jgi:hypothetical protein
MGKKGSETTNTNWISPEDQARVRQGRTYGDLASQSARGIQEAGVNPYSKQAAGNYGDLYNQYGNAAQFGSDYGQRAMMFAGQTGLEGMEQYLNPQLAAYFGGMNPVYDRMRADEYSQAGQDAMMSGAYGGSRHAMLAKARLGGIDQQQGADYGRYQGMAGQEAIRAMFSERERMGGLGQNMLGYGLNALGGQGAMAGNMANMGDYMRQIEQLQNERRAKNDAMASAQQQSSYGQDIQSGTTEKTEKGWLEGALPFAMNAASMFIPGAQLAGPLMGGMMQGMYGGNEAQAGNFGSQYSDPWQGMNLGGGGGGGNANALFSPVPPGGFFGGG